MNNKKLLFGALVLVFMLGLNAKHAFNDYGMKNGKLHLEVLAQSSSGGGNSSGTMYYIIHENSCSVTLSGGASGGVFYIFGIKYTLAANATLTISFSDVKRDCEINGTFLCTTKSCADFWKGSGAPGY